MENHFDVIVVGGGAVGASTLFSLTEVGITKSLLLEGKSNLGRGTTGAWGSLIRVYHLNPRTTDLASESVPYYLNFRERVGRDAGYVETGSLYFLKAHCRDLLKARLVQVSRGNLKPELITAAEGKKRFPTFHWYEDDLAIYEPYAGYACPWTTTEAWVQSACDAGAVFKVDNPVVDFIVKGSRLLGVEVRSGERFYANKIVLATGVWSLELGQKLGLTLPVEKRVIQVNHFHRQNKETREPFFIDPQAQAFGRPAPDGSFVGGCLGEPLEQGTESLGKMESHSTGFLETISLKEANRAKLNLSTRLNWIKNAALLGGVRAVEAYTDDFNGLLTFSSEYENLLLATGWSCTGFTLAPVIGRKVTQMILEKESAVKPILQPSVQGEAYV